MLHAFPHTDLEFTFAVFKVMVRNYLYYLFALFYAGIVAARKLFPTLVYFKHIQFKRLGTAGKIKSQQILFPVI